MRVKNKYILQTTHLKNSLTVSHKEERERTIKALVDHLLLAKEIPDKDVPNHGIFDALQLLGSPQYS